MKNKKRLVVLAILLVPLLVVVTVYVLRDRDKRPSELTAEGKLVLLREKSAALGDMDNGAYDQALPALEKIVRELPNEPLGYRDLAIALFKPVAQSNDSALSDKETDRVNRLLAVVDKLLQIDGETFGSRYLAGRVYAKQAELLRVSNPKKGQEFIAKAKEQFSEAARLSPQDPAPLFEIYELERKFGPDAERLSDEGLKALRSAHARTPDNLPCLLELLEHLMARKDPERTAVVEQALKLLPGDIDTLQAGAQPRQSLEKIAKLLTQNANEVPPDVFSELNSARSQLRQFFGFYKRDEARLKPHPMEFVLEDFRPEFYANLPVESEPAIEVRFTPFQPWTAPVTDIVAARHDDLTCNDGYATVVLRHVGGKTRVETVPSQFDQLQLPPIEIDGQFGAFQLADLDLDIQARPAEAKATGNIPADLDLILYGQDGVRLLEQRKEAGSRRWVDRTADCKLPPLKNVRWLLNCDMDHDGNLDLIVGLENVRSLVGEKGVHILRNRGAWAFEDVTGRSTGLEKLDTIAGVFGDFDRDGDLDFVLLGKDGSLHILENRRGGKFEERDSGVKITRGTCLATADVNADGRLDFLIGHGRGATVLLANDKGFPVPDAKRLELPRPPAAGIGVIDYDNDGWPDVWVGGSEAAPAKASALSLYRNLRGTEFESATSILPPIPGPIQSVQATDWDNDGDLDLIILHGGGQLTALRNDGGNQNHWLNLRLHAELIRDDSGQGQAAKSNYRCIGGTAELRAGRHFQMQQVTDTVTHFGLGQRKQVDALRVIWTNGVPQAEVRPKIDQTLVENQRAKGSCPYLFTWDGERFVFVTDCLWSSALGMKLAHGVDMTHDRQHNYLVIPGDKLKPRDGRHSLRFTNELWEVPYLDVAQLWAVDHPAEVEIYTNQRIPPDPKEEFKVLTVRQRHYPRAARDHQGRDVLSVINRHDGQYLGGFRRLRYVGLAEPHWLELDLGNLSAAKTATLFLTGWIWPTDTSGNIAISLDPRFAGPTGVIGGAQPPTLLVPNGNGGWLTANPMMGFPSGKMQTVAVPLPLDQFPLGDYRIRIATMMELYWDEVFFTLDEPTAELDVRRLPVSHADLHYRGYSRIIQAAPASPFVYDYEDVDPAPLWLPIPGKFVRYGPVTELLHEPDSCYVVMSPGDELALEFVELPPPKPGWKRSFIFYGNGWLKDFDMNGSAGDHIGPYPFDGMSRYPYEPPEVFPADGPHGRFLREYLTREASGGEFWELLRPVENRTRRSE